VENRLLTASTPGRPEGMSRRHLFRTAVTSGQLAAGTALVASAACGTGQSAAPPAPSASTLTGSASLLVRTNNNENKYQNEAVVPAVRQQFPNLTVEIVSVPAGDAYLDKYTAMQAGGTPPELFSAYGTGFPDYYFIGGVADLTSYITRDKIDLTTYLPQVKDVVDTIYKRNGKFYALPNFTSHGWFVLYNTNLLAQAGLKNPPVDWEDKSWTWDVFLDYARKLTKNPGTPDVIFGTSPYATGSSTMPELSTWLAGDTAFKPEHYKLGVATASNFDTPGVADGLQLVQDLMWKYRVAPTPAERTALSGLGNLFNVGRQAMSITSAIPTASAITTFKWGAAAMPRYKDNKVGVYIQPWMIADSAKNKEGGWAALKYMVSEAGQRAWYQITSQPPASKVVHQDWLKSVESFVPAADMAKISDGADRHNQLVGSHAFVSWAKIQVTFDEEANGVNANQLTPRDFITRAKPKADAIIADVKKQAEARFGTK
jgi:multiple sugar transport system substrate-binding protein